MFSKLKAKSFKKISIFLFATFYAAFVAKLASADDIDIYTRAVSYGEGGAPVMTWVIDTSGSMGFKIDVDETGSASNVFEERMFLLQNVLHDQLTAMKGTFKVGLMSYDSGSRSGTLEAEAKALKGIETSSLDDGVATGGVSNFRVTKDVAWTKGGSARDGEVEFSFPRIIRQGGEVDLGSAVQGTWFSSGGQDSDPNNGSLDLQGAVAGNKVVFFDPDWNGPRYRDVTFYLDKDNDGDSADPYLYILDDNGNVVGSNNDRQEGGKSCPWNRWYLDGNICRHQWYWWWTWPPIESEADINSTVEVTLDKYDDYTIVAGTDSPGQAGDFTITIDRNWKGDFFSYTPGTVEAQSVAFRFSDVDIPRGATITSAKLIVEIQEDADDAQNIDIKVDQSLAPLPLQGTTIESERDWFTQSTAFYGTYDEVDDMEIDVKYLLEQKVKQDGWCGGSDMVFMIEGKDPVWADPLLKEKYIGPDPYLVETDETGDAPTPRLEIDWKPGGTPCYSKTVNVKPGSIADDVELDSSLVVDTDNTQLNMGSGGQVGVRFPFVKLPNAVNESGSAIGLDIPNAFVRLTAANDANPGTIKIQAIQEGIAQPFYDDSASVLDRPLGPAIEWTPGSWELDRVYTSPNLKSIIQPLLERQDWEYQGTIGLMFSSSSGENVKFYAWENLSGSDSRVKSYNWVYETYDWNNLGYKAAELTIMASANEPFEDGDSYRKELWDELMGEDFAPGGGTPISGSFLEAAEYMLGKGSYDSPLDEVGKCQANTLVLLTDGEESYRTSPDQSGFEAITGEPGCYDSWGCNRELAEALKEGPVWYDSPVDADDDGKRPVKTYTIAYGPNQNAGENMNQVALAGDGQFYTAQNASTLSQAFKDIVGSVSDAGASISVPGVAVSAFNRITVLDEVYYSLFKPSVRRSWLGNAKRYMLLDKEIRDVHKNAAIDLDSTYFKNDSQSWWSDMVDGTSVPVGGAAEHIDPVTRNIYTFIGSNGVNLDGGGSAAGPDRGIPLNGSGNAFNIRTHGESKLTPPDVGVDRLEDLPDSQKNSRTLKVIKWVAGGTESEPRREMGSPLHSSPVMVNYVEKSGELVSTVFVSTTEGYLHAIDTGEPSYSSVSKNLANRGGKELFSFMPKETLVNAALLEENAVVDFNSSDYEHIYGLDSTWTYWREAGDNPAIGSSDHVYLYGGMRRGGRMVYGLNVSDVYFEGDNDPKLLFAVGYSDVEGSATPGFENIGQTWSTPRVRKTIWGGQERTVLLMGGGYDPDHDETGHHGGADLGSQVFMLDAVTGEILWSETSLKNSIPARIAPFDRSGDNYFDSFYAVDIEGNVMRFDMNGSRNDFNQHLVAQLGGPGNDRKFYHEPSVANFKNLKTGEIDMMLAIGSGYRALPSDKSTQERMHLIFDRGAHTNEPSAPDEVIDDSKLTELKESDFDTGLSIDPSDPDGIYQIPGWRFDFEKPEGEKSLGAPLIFNGNLIFTTYTHEEPDTTTCTPVIGQTRLYVMDIAGKGNADIFGGEEGDVFIGDVTPGMSSGVQLLTVANTNPDEPPTPALLVDKKLLTVGGEGCEDGNCDGYEEKLCRLVSCEGRDLDRSSWYSRTMSADEGEFFP